MDTTATLGFVFDSTGKRVLLVHKKKPVWQNGKLNGIGGKIESGENIHECIARECMEESSLKIPPQNWQHFGTIQEKDCDIEVFATQYLGAVTDAVKTDHEEIEWFYHKRLPTTVIKNLYFLIPAAYQKLQGYRFEKIVIKY